MTVVAGVDEAGYGPLLGPLVVTGVAFSLPAAVTEQCLWNRLQASVTHRPSKSNRRLPIADSKILYARKGGLAMLERTALVMSCVAGLPIERFESFMSSIAPSALRDLAEYPWYRGFNCTLPVANDRKSIILAANAVRRDLNDQGVALRGVFCELLPEGHFNRRVDSTRNKATVSLGLTLRSVARIAAVAEGHRVHVHVDRQGGRLHYAEALMTAFGHRSAAILSESPECSAYRLPGPQGPHEVAFHTHGEDKQMPIALASVFSKYVRELLMSALNQYWAQRVNGLKPTAGYYQDAQRFLADIAVEADRETLDRKLLVRNR